MKRLVVVTLFVATLNFAATLNANSQGTVTDIDGNTYSTVIIGDQEWMAENLRVSRYRNGDALLFDQPFKEWQKSSEGIWAYYDNDQSYNNLYGKLYNWYATIDSRGLCPTGWRVPTDEDWQILTEFVDPNAWGNNNTLGTKLKSRRQVNSPLGGEYSTNVHPRWDEHSTKYGTDNFGFGALPGGTYTQGNSFTHLGQFAYFWSTTESQEKQAWVRSIKFSNRGMSRGQYLKSIGLSVRCIKGGEQAVQVPQLNTMQASNITTTSATSGGDVLADGGAAVTARGVVWSTTPNPTIDNNMGITSNGSGLGEFTSNITGLEPGTNYWVRAYATNSAGTGYGIQIKIQTLGDGVAYYTLNVTIEPQESGTVEGTGAHEPGTQVTLTATPNPGYLFVNWTINDEVISTETSFSYTMPAANVTISANFEEDYNPTNGIIVHDATAEAGTQITVEVEMVNQGDIIAFQMDFELPNGFTYVEGSYTLSDRSQGHTPGQSILSDGKLRVLAYSATNNVFLGNSGILFTFKLNTPVQVGTWNIEPTNAILTNTNFENVFDESQSGTITLIDATADGQPCPGTPTVTDIDGNVYNTVQIGEQCWMKENLRVTKYNDNTSIPTGQTNAEWAELSSGAYAIYPHTEIEGLNSDNEILEAYGAYYNWFAINDVRKLCPTGWRIPSNIEWQTLLEFVGGSSIAGSKLKSTRTEPTDHPRWEFPNEWATDEFGFSALPSGQRYFSGEYTPVYGYGIGTLGGWWSTTIFDQNKIWMRSMMFDQPHVGNYGTYKTSGISVRCIKD